MELNSGLNHSNLDEFEYYLIDGRFPPQGESKLYNLAYDAWKTNWLATYRELESQAQPSPNEFFRFDVVSVLLWRGQVIGLHLYNFFDIEAEAHQEHPFFNLYTAQIWADLQEQGFRKLMPLEYLWVDRSWRRSVTNISIADVLIHCGLEVFRLSDADAAVGVTRNDRKVNNSVYRTGADAIAENLSLHNVSVDLCLWRREKLRFVLSGVEQELFRELWSRRHMMLRQHQNFLEGEFREFKVSENTD